MCVYIVDLCALGEGWDTHTHTQKRTRTIWPDICTNERVLVDSAGVPGWGGGYPSNLQSSSPVGSNGFHPCCQIGFVLSSPLYLLTTMFYLLSWPPSELPL